MGDFRYMGKSLSGVQRGLGSLTDANISNPQDGDTLVYNGTTGKWESKHAEKIVIQGQTNETFAGILNRLWQQINLNKLTPRSYLKYYYGDNWYNYYINYVSNSEIHFLSTTGLSTTSISVSCLIVRTSSMWHSAQVAGTTYTYTNYTGNIAGPTVKVELYY